MPTLAAISDALPRQRRAMDFIMSENEFKTMVDMDGGFCTSCGEEVYGIEPDAEGYECEACGSCRVMGIKNMLLSGYIIITGE